MDIRAEAQELDLDSTIHTTLVEALQLLNARSCSMWYVSNGQCVCHDAVGQGADDIVGQWLGLECDSTAATADDVMSAFLTQTSSDRAVAVPVWVDDHLTGIVQATSSETGQFDDQSLALLEVLVGWMSIVMEKIELQKYYQELFERAPVPLYRASPDGQILAINDAALELLGECDGKSASYGGRSSISSWFADPRDYLAWKRGDSPQVFQIIRNDGEMIWVQDTSRAVENAAGMLLYYEGTLKDITARRRAKQALNGLIESERSPGARITRLVLRAYAVMEAYDLDEISCAEATRRFREAQIEAVGLRRYIYDALGDRGNYLAQSVVFWYGDEPYPHEVDGTDTVSDALVELAQSVGLPDKVEFEVEDKTYLI